MRPEKDDYYVFETGPFGFYETPLEILLADLGVKELVIART
jgi:hypothetical protein